MKQGAALPRTGLAWIHGAGGGDMQALQRGYGLASYGRQPGGTWRWRWVRASVAQRQPAPPPAGVRDVRDKIAQRWAACERRRRHRPE